jgi:hypothetical protein
LAAACLFIMLIWPRNQGQKTEVVKHNDSPPSKGGGPLNRQAQQDPGASLGTFTWPLDETSPMLASTSIPPDLLD